MTVCRLVKVKGAVDRLYAYDPVRLLSDEAKEVVLDALHRHGWFVSHRQLETSASTRALMKLVVAHHG